MKTLGHESGEIHQPPAEVAAGHVLDEIHWVFAGGTIKE